jgi:hypothetical protein
VLAYASRRLGREEIRFLFSRRLDGTPDVLGLDRTTIERGLVRIDVGPLSAGATQRLVRERLDIPRRAAELGPGIRYVRTTFLPGDETILHLFEAPSVEELEAAGRQAALSFERIVEAIEQATPAAEEAQ